MKLKYLISTIISIVAIQAVAHTPCSEISKGGQHPYLVCDSVLEERLALLDLPEQDSVLIVYNEYMTSYDSLFKVRCLERGLPVEFRLLPMAMNGFSNNDVSAYKSGVWCMNIPIARRHGLMVDAHYDERKNIELQTEAALDYLQELYAYFNEDFWLTVLAFTNSATELHDASLEINNGEDIWQWYTNDLLSQREVIPELMKYMYLSEYWPKCSQVNKSSMLEIRDTLLVSILVSTLEMNIDSFYINNPMLSSKTDRLMPGYKLYLSDYAIEGYNLHLNTMVLESRATIGTIEEQRRKQREVEIAKQQAPKVYRVKSGDTLGHIAKRYGVTVSQLKRWNNLKSDLLQINQRLIIQQ